MLELDAVQINFSQDNILVMNVALAVVMFGVALGIKSDDFKKVLAHPKFLCLGVLLQFVLLPLVTYFLIILLAPKASIALGMMLVAACPGGNISNFMTQHAGGNAALSVSLTAIATVLALVMTPFNFHLYGNLYAPTSELLQTIQLNPYALGKVVFLILGLPLIFGMLVRKKNPIIAAKLASLLKPLSIAIFFVFVVVAFLKNLEIFKQTIKLIFAYGIIHNTIAIGLGLFVAFCFRVPAAERKTLAIESGIQNSGLGLVLIFTFFKGLGGMALIAAFWGIWHIISGLMLSIYWSRRT